MGCRSGCSRSQERAEGVGAAGRAEGGGRARAGRGEPSVAGWGWEPRRRRGWLEELRFPPRLPGWRQAAGGRRAERSTLAAGFTPGDHGQQEPGRLLPTLTAQVTPVPGPSPNHPGFMPEAALAASRPALGVQPGLGLLLGHK
jgi:hypothetical protein